MKEIEKEENKEKLQQFVAVIADPERMGLSVAQIAEKFEIGVDTIYRWVSTPAISKLIKEKRASYIKLELPKIDLALIRAAKRGDIRAMDLVYQRWDEWMPKTRQELSGFVESGEMEAEKKARRESVKRFLAEITDGGNTTKVEDEGLKE